jgi:glutathione S-transferase
VLLYEWAALPECYAVRLLAAILEVPLTLRHVDYYPAHEHESDAFLTLNPLGTLPVLDTGETILLDWLGALTYLAARHDPERRWLPLEHTDRMASLLEWLSVARALSESAGAARLHDSIGQEADIAGCRAKAHALLRHLERHLWFGERAGCSWLLQNEHPTIADLAVFVNVILCEEGGVERLDYPAVRRWTDRVKQIPGFVVTSGVFPAATLEVKQGPGA